jgi:apolipoprotein N-acyltransferase
MPSHDSRSATAGASLVARAVDAANAGSGRAGDVAAVVAGAPLVLAFSPFGFFPLAPLGFAVLLVLWSGCSARRAALRGFAFGASGFLCGTYWLYISLHKFGGAPAFVAVPLMLGLVTLMASYFAATGWLVVRLFPRPGPIRWLLGAPGLWVLVEWLRSWVATGFPWFAYGYSQTDTVLVGFAPVLGLFGVSLAVTLSGGALLALVGGSKASRIAALVLLAGLLGGGFALDRLEWSTPLDGPLDVAVVQGGISQDKKWKADQLPKTKRLYRELTDQHWDADLVVWPEAAIPDLLHNYRDYLARSSTACPCSRTRPGGCTWGTCATTPSATSSPATSACSARTCCSPWAGTPSGCRPRTPPSSTASRRRSGPDPTSPT